ncbi:MAG: 1-hydroxycarotenoid 3,4-desaturase CrtD [Luteibaculaceae bacterium]
MKIAVIGSGIAGIAASIRLRVQGHDVVVFEKNSFPGGKLSSFTLDSYRFDAGPSLFTLPQLVLELFTLAKKDTSEFPFIKKTSSCTYFWEDSENPFISPANPKDFVEQASVYFNEPEENLKKYVTSAENLYKSAGKLFLEKPLNKVSTWFSQETLGTLKYAGKKELLGTLNEKNEAYFSNPKLVQLFNRYATYNGSDPFQAPGMLSMIPHLELNEGTYIPKNGMHQITQSLYNLALELGVLFNFSSNVEQIVLENNTVTGIKLPHTVEPVDAAVCNVDVFYAYKNLLPQLKLANRVASAEPSSSALIFYWGVKKEFPNLDLHNILFSKNYKEEFNHIFKEKKLYHDPTVYINITSKDVPNDAPKGCENWFVMINTSAYFGEDWEVLRAEAKRNILSKIENCLGINVEPYIEQEHFLDPPSIDSRTGSYRGSLYGTSSNSTFSAFMRHQNQHHKINNLFFLGGSVHPGGGIPLCLHSAKIVSEELLNSLN